MFAMLDLMKQVVYVCKAGVQVDCDVIWKVCFVCVCMCVCVFMYVCVCVFKYVCVCVCCAYI